MIHSFPYNSKEQDIQYLIDFNTEITASIIMKAAGKAAVAVPDYRLHLFELYPANLRGADFGVAVRPRGCGAARCRMHRRLAQNAARCSD